MFLLFYLRIPYREISMGQRFLSLIFENLYSTHESIQRMQYENIISHP